MKFWSISGKPFSLCHDHQYYSCVDINSHVELLMVFGWFIFIILFSTIFLDLFGGTSSSLNCIFLLFCERDITMWLTLSEFYEESSLLGICIFTLPYPSSDRYITILLWWRKKVNKETFIAFKQQKMLLLWKLQLLGQIEIEYVESRRSWRLKQIVTLLSYFFSL